ncbi:chemotaxis protein [Alcaligenes faecalis]|uniref:MFS transporter n=1 Tax=Alcaligenes faecalis TaxID=511 RepID=UPI000A2DA3C6|nr:MFS transporter [Alcaligenes faecalis]OSZ35118.1 chemotaxis protein [Alcaligenes faecalis]OSZ41689.1 chemotaxis protein [Alcaligenes faecalis]
MSSLKTTGTIPSAVYLLALSLFAMGSAEFLMGGILPMIAEDLRISLPTAGTLISAFAVGALIGGPPFAILALRWPSRSALFISQVAFIAATVVSLLAQGYWAILLARFGMGLAYACFWSVAAATAVQLSPPDRRAKALSIVVSGLTVAMVLGGPAGTYISEATGWRGGFWAVIAVTVISAVAVLLALPKHTARDAKEPDLVTELRAMKRPALWVAYATTMFTTAAYMGTFGYIAALLMEVSGLNAEWLPAVLILFGVGAFIGLTIGGRTADAQPRGTLVVGIIGLIVSSAIIALFAASVWATVAMVFMLGLAGFLLNPAVWGRVYVLAPDAPMLAGATNASAFQAGLTLAPLLAGIPISLGYGVASVAWVGVIIAVVSLLLAGLDARLSRTAAHSR